MSMNYIQNKWPLLIKNNYVYDQLNDLSGVLVISNVNNSFGLMFYWQNIKKQNYHAIVINLQDFRTLVDYNNYLLIEEETVPITTNEDDLVYLFKNSSDQIFFKVAKLSLKLDNLYMFEYINALKYYLFIDYSNMKIAISRFSLKNQFEIFNETISSGFLFKTDLYIVTFTNSVYVFQKPSLKSPIEIVSFIKYQLHDFFGCNSQYKVIYSNPACSDKEENMKSLLMIIHYNKTN